MAGTGAATTTVTASGLNSALARWERKSSLASLAPARIDTGSGNHTAPICLPTRQQLSSLSAITGASTGTGSGSKTPKTPKTPHAYGVGAVGTSSTAPVPLSASNWQPKTPKSAGAKPAPLLSLSASKIKNNSRTPKSAGPNGAAGGDRFIPTREPELPATATATATGSATATTATGAGHTAPITVSGMTAAQVKAAVHAAPTALAAKFADENAVAGVCAVAPNAPAGPTAAAVGHAVAVASATATAAASGVAATAADIKQAADFNAKLAETVLGDTANAKEKILSFKNKAPRPTGAFDHNLRVIYSQNKSVSGTALNAGLVGGAGGSVKRTLRSLSSTPERVLDAPELLSDFYLNLLDWSNTNLLAVALNSKILLWNANDSSVIQLMECKAEQEQVTSVSWMGDGLHLAVGTSTNQIELYNVETQKLIRTMRGSHTARIGALSWNDSIVSSGSRDSTIVHHDVREAKHEVARLVGYHSQEVCGLKWCPNGKELASSGNDNLVCIWDGVNATAPKFTFNDSAAGVKALAWCPFQSQLLATGSGTADRHIRFYNTRSGALVNSIDTKSQNQLTVWKYPAMVKVTDLLGHTSRVLHTALSPDGTTVCSAGDETLRFWKLWEPVQLVNKKNAAAAVTTSKGLNTMNIR